MEDKQTQQQVFALRIIKEFSPSTGQMKVEVKSKSEGMPMAEAIIIVEGWLQAEKEKMTGPLFRKDPHLEQR